MPNTLAHVGVQGILTRLALPNADVRWIYVGLVIPDIPWILQRVVLFSAPAVDPFVLRSYVIIQASLIGSLVLCAAVAFLARKLWLTFAILGGNAFLHLVLDAMQTKWANGVHFLAPFSWELTNWGLFWPKSLPTYAMTAAGLVFIVWYWRSALLQPLKFRSFTYGRVAGASGLLAAYLLLPFLMIQGPIEADTHFLDTLQESDSRAGSYVEIDRARYSEAEDGPYVRFYGGTLELAVSRVQASPPAKISIRGQFVDNELIEVSEYHVHRGPWRDYASYIGLLFVTIALFAGAFHEFSSRKVLNT